MRWLDFEHEIGHIKQRMRFQHEGDYPTERESVKPTGGKTKGPQDGVLTRNMDICMELHNRLKEFNRLFSRRVPYFVLQEHATAIRWYFEKYGKFRDPQCPGKFRSRTLQAWNEQYLPDIGEECRRYTQHIRLYKETFGVVLEVAPEATLMETYASSEEPRKYVSEQEILIEIGYIEIDIENGVFGNERYKLDEILQMQDISRERKWHEATFELIRIVSIHPELAELKGDFGIE